VGVVQRLESPIIGLKNFNNWVKSVMITRFAHPALTKSRTRAGNGTDGFRGGRRGREDDTGVGKVLDMGCGKGGDMTKWAKAKVREFFGVGTATYNSFSFFVSAESMSPQILQRFQLSKLGQDGSLSVGQDLLQHLPRWIAIPSL